MAWGKAGSVTLDANDDVISLTGFTPSKFSTYLLHAVEGSGTLEPRFRLNNDPSGHSNRMARDGDADTTAPSRGDWVTSITDASDDNFNVGYLCNIDGKEKLGITRCTVNNGTSYTTYPRRREVYSKYTDSGSNAQITRFDNIDTDTSALKGIGSNLTLLGSDMTPASAIPFPTNVELGSRAEITDSRKMFNYSDVSTSELKAYYKFDESSGNIINQATSVGSSDSLGTDADMTISGATYSQTGKIGNALSFDGSNDFGTLGSSLSQWNLFHGTGDWTLNYWINFGAFTSEAKIFSNLDSTETRGINVRVGGSDPDGTIGLSIKSDNGFMVNTGSISFNQTLSTGTWYMITLTCDHSLSSANYQVSVNGTGQGTANRSVLGSGNNAEHSTKIMRRGGSSDGFVNADMDEMSVWNRLLTADEITSLYNSNSGRAISSGIFTEWQEIGA